MVQLASILAWGASGRPFESGHSDNKRIACYRFIFLYFNIGFKLLRYYYFFTAHISYPENHGQQEGVNHLLRKQKIGNARAKVLVN